MAFKTISEGAVKLNIPIAKRIYDADVFYNPVMVVNWDISESNSKINDVKIIFTHLVSQFILEVCLFHLLLYGKHSCQSNNFDIMNPNT